MSVGLTAVLFVFLWVLTFFPAWLLVIKIAVALKSSKRNWPKLIALFLVYEFVIILPYLVILWKLSTKSDIWLAVVSALATLILVSSIIQVFDIDKLKKGLWNIYARCYDSLLSFYPYKELVELVSQRVVPYLHDGSQIADIGCGTGNIAIKLVRKNPNISLIAVEPSVPMLRRARKKLAAISGSKVSYVTKDANSFLGSVADSSLDVIVMCNVLYTVLDRSQFWELLAKKLKNNGVAIITNSDRDGSSALIKYHIQHAGYWALFKPGLLLVGMIDNLISELSSGEYFMFTPQTELEKEVQAAGLTLHDIERCYGGKQAGVNLLFTIRKK